MRILNEGSRGQIMAGRDDLEVVTTEEPPLELSFIQPQLFDREFSPTEQEDIDKAFRTLLPYAKNSPAIAAALHIMLGHPTVYGCAFYNLRAGKLIADRNASGKNLIFVKNELNHHPLPWTFYLDMDVLY